MKANVQILTDPFLNPDRRLIWSAGDKEFHSVRVLAALQHSCWELNFVAFLKVRRRENRVMFAVVGMQHLGRRFKHRAPGQRPEGAASNPRSQQRQEESGKGACRAAAWPSFQCLFTLSKYLFLLCPTSQRTLPSLQLEVRPRMLQRPYEVYRTRKSRQEPFSDSGVEKLTVAGFKHPTILRNPASDREREAGAAWYIRYTLCLYT